MRKELEGLQRPIVCLNMIVKNESKIIERCLRNVMDIVDSWCIIDTGSTDGTQEIIKRVMADKPGELIERPWKNFGHNRNEALGFARKWGDWIFLTDADMVLVNQGFNRNQLDPAVDAYDVIQDNHGTRYYNFRLLNTKKEWKCIGVTHEYYDAVGGVQNRQKLDSIWFNDVSDGGSKSDKFERDAMLLEQGLKDEPYNARYMFYLAQTYRDTQQWDKAIEWYQKRVDAGGWDEEVFFAKYMIAWIKAQREDSWDDILKAGMDAWLYRPWRNEPMWLMATEARKKNLWYHAYQFSKICATTPYPQHDLLFVAAAAYGAPVMDEYAVAAFYSGNHEESIRACENLLQRQDFPPQEAPRIKRNMWFAQKNLGMWGPENMQKFIEDTKKEIETL